MQRLYEAEAAVASQAAEHSKRDSDHIARLEGRLEEALALSDAAEQEKEQMQHQLHEAQVRACAELSSVMPLTRSCLTTCEQLDLVVQPCIKEQTSGFATINGHAWRSG